MISLTCTNCRTVLSIDEAFAGGVCRCQHCGTIQTVPSHLKRTATAGASASSKPQKALYQNERTKSDSGVRVGTGLDDLAEVVASSGLGGSGLSGSGLSSSGLGRLRTPAGAKLPPRSLTPWLVGAGVIIVVLLVLVLYLSMRSPTPSPTTQQPGGGLPIAAKPAPSFCGIPLEGNVIVYVLDRGNGTRDLLDPLKEATYKSIESLGADRKFQIIFWDNHQREEAFPAGLPAYATPENLASCRRALADVIAFGQSDASPALRKAFTGRADEIILATGKSLELENTFTTEVMTLRGNSTTKIHTIALGDSTSAILNEIAARTKAQYRTLTAAQLRSFAE